MALLLFREIDLTSRNVRPFSSAANHASLRRNPEGDWKAETMHGEGT
jgi:hypothetical protein